MTVKAFLLDSLLLLLADHKRVWMKWSSLRRRDGESPQQHCRSGKIWTGGSHYWYWSLYIWRLLLQIFVSKVYCKKKKEENLFSLNSMAIKSAKGRSLHLLQWQTPMYFLEWDWSTLFSIFSPNVFLPLHIILAFYSGLCTANWMDSLVGFISTASKSGIYPF